MITSTTFSATLYNTSLFSFVLDLLQLNATMRPTIIVLLSLLSSGTGIMAARSELEAEQYKALAEQMHFDPADTHGVRSSMAGSHRWQEDGDAEDAAHDDRDDGKCW